MRYRVTPEQYEELIKARDNWPEKLSYLWRGLFGGRCAIGYLTFISGLKDEDVKGGFFGPEIFKKQGLEKLSQIYGIPKDIFDNLYYKNLKASGSRVRSEVVLMAFRNFLNNVELIYENKIKSIEEEVDNSEAEDYSPFYSLEREKELVSV